MRFLLVVVVLAGCYEPSLAPCTVRCRLTFDCPGAMACGDDKFCHVDTNEAAGPCIPLKCSDVPNSCGAQRLRGKPGDCTKATASYRKFISLAPKSNERPQAEGLIAELAPCVEQEAKPKPAPVIPPLQAVTPPSTQPAPVMPPREGGGDGKGKRFAGYAVGGAGIVLVATGVYFGAKARRLGDEVSDECADGCDWNLVKDKDAEGNSAETTQYVLYGVGLAAIAAGGVLWWMGNKDAKSSNVAVTPTQGGAAVSWSGAW